MRFTRMRLGLLLGLTFGILVGLPMAAPALAAPSIASHTSQSHASRATDTTSTINGVVANGTHSNTPVAGQQVTLQATDTAPLASGNATGAPVSHDLETVTTDAQGHFTFGDVPAGTADVFAVYTHFQGGLYASKAITVTPGSANTTTLTVYDATTSDTALSIKNVTVLVRPPDVTHGLMGIGEFVTFQNSGNTAFVGTASATTSSGMPALVRFAVPAGASNLSPGAGFVGTQILTIGTGFGATATIPPGTSSFAFAFDMPYTGTSATYTYTPVYPTAQVIVLVPPTMRAERNTFTAQGTISVFDGQYQVFQTSSAPSGGVGLGLTGLPQAGERGDLNFPVLVALGAVLAVLAALALGLAVWRGDLAFIATRFAGARPREAAVGTDQATASTLASGTHAAARQRLLREIAALESPDAERTLTQRDRERRIAALRAEARLLLEEDLAGMSSASATIEPARGERTTGSGLAPASTGHTRNAYERNACEGYEGEEAAR